MFSVVLYVRFEISSQGHYPVGYAASGMPGTVTVVSQTRTVGPGMSYPAAGAYPAYPTGTAMPPGSYGAPGYPPAPAVNPAYPAPGYAPPPPYAGGGELSCYMMLTDIFLVSSSVSRM
jgi:hypothetical protein